MNYVCYFKALKLSFSLLLLLDLGKLMLNSSKLDIFKILNAAQLIGLPVSVSHPFIRLSAACQQPDTPTVELQIYGVAGKSLVISH